jgi:hypothetical protein
LVIVPLLLFSIALTAPVAARHHVDLTAWTLRSWLVTLGFLVLLVVAMSVQLRFTVHRQLAFVTLGELPLLLALFYLPPLVVLVIRALAAAIDQAVRRTGLVKASFNIAAQVAGTACANAVIVGFGSKMELHDPRSWLLLGGAVFACSLTTVGAFGALTALMLKKKKR